MFSIVGFSSPAMIELLKQRLHCAGDFRVIVKPARFPFGFAFHGNLDLEAVAVHSPALMSLRRVRKSLRRFKLKIFCQPNTHCRESRIAHCACHPEPRRRRGTTTSSKFQAPGKHQTSNIKPGRCPLELRCLELSGAWLLELGASTGPSARYASLGMTRVSLTRPAASASR